MVLYSSMVEDLKTQGPDQPCEPDGPPDQDPVRVRLRSDSWPSTSFPDHQRLGDRRDTKDGTTDSNHAEGS